MAIISNGNTIIDAGAIDANEVNTTQIVNSSVTTAKLADSSVSLAKLTATGTKDATTFLRGDNTFAAAGGGVNTPAFLAYRAAEQNLSNLTWNKVQFNTELFDTASAFDTTLYRFTVPAGEGGKYVFSIITTVRNDERDIKQNHIDLRKNGSSIRTFREEPLPTVYARLQNSVTYIEPANAGDYYEIYVFPQGTSPKLSNEATVFNGFKIIE